MKVGTDGVLLGAWVAVGGDERRILDIGTGTGLIALMMAQRVEDDGVAIDAVEVDAASAEQARENIARSQWSRQINVHNVDIQSFESAVTYDLIVTNPPYFVDSLQSPDRGRTTARHTQELTFAELVAAVVRLLSGAGRLAIILPAVESRLFDREVEICGKLRLIRRCEVLGKTSAPIKRVMSEYERVEEAETEAVAGELKSETLAIRGSGQSDFTEEYREITRDFYLKF